MGVDLGLFWRRREKWRAGRVDKTETLNWLTTGLLVLRRMDSIWKSGEAREHFLSYTRPQRWRGRPRDRESQLISSARALACSRNAIGPDGAKALAVPLKKLTALKTLDLRC